MNILEIKKQLIKSLSNQDLTELTIALSQHLETALEVGNVIDEFTDKRFADGLVCPYCHKDNTVKNGRVRGKQRYYCKDCKRTFNAYTKTLLANTKKPLSLWVKYADCMSRQMTLRATAQELDISLSTSFYMRHKILTALRNYMGIDDLSGIIEMDETFFAESFKGNHKLHNQVWTAPRNSGKSRHRGKEVKYRGISHEQTCISTAIDRNGGLVVVPVCMGRLTTAALDRTYQDNIEEHSTICTDSHRAYIKFAQNVNADLVQIESGKHKKDIYHINHINSLHNKLKHWMRLRYGVATKYVGNYMYWFNWTEKTKGISRYTKCKDLIYNSSSAIMELTREDIKCLSPFTDFRENKEVSS